MYDSNEYSKDFIAGQLNICVGEAAKAYELLDIKKFKNESLYFLGEGKNLKKPIKLVITILFSFNIVFKVSSLVNLNSGLIAKASLVKKSSIGKKDTLSV